MLVIYNIFSFVHLVNISTKWSLVLSCLFCLYHMIPKFTVTFLKELLIGQASLSPTRASLKKCWKRHLKPKCIFNQIMQWWSCIWINSSWLCVSNYVFILIAILFSHLSCITWWKWVWLFICYSVFRTFAVLNVNSTNVQTTEILILGEDITDLIFQGIRGKCYYFGRYNISDS